MTRFEKDKQEILAGNTRMVMEERKKEINQLVNSLLECHNGFRAQCIAQEIKRKKREYEELDEMI